jgi:hypothetical protein
MRIFESKRYFKIVCYLLTGALLLMPLAHAGAMQVKVDPTTNSGHGNPCHHQTGQPSTNTVNSAEPVNTVDVCGQDKLCQFICSVAISPPPDQITVSQLNSTGVRFISTKVKPDLVSFSPPYKPPRS